MLAALGLATARTTLLASVAQPVRAAKRSKAKRPARPAASLVPTRRSTRHKKGFDIHDDNTQGTAVEHAAQAVYEDSVAGLGSVRKSLHCPSTSNQLIP